jgi:hypothetical protein
LPLRRCSAGSVRTGLRRVLYFHCKTSGSVCCRHRPLRRTCSGCRTTGKRAATWRNRFRNDGTADRVVRAGVEVDRCPVWGHWARPVIFVGNVRTGFVVSCTFTVKLPVRLLPSSRSRSHPRCRAVSGKCSRSRGDIQIRRGIEIIGSW